MSKRGIVIHAKGSRARHIPKRALRSSLFHFVTCKVCRRQVWPELTIPDALAKEYKR